MWGVILSFMERLNNFESFLVFFFLRKKEDKKKKKKIKEEENLHVMCGGNALKNDFGFRRIHISVYPSCPCCHPFVVSNQPVHIFLHILAILNVIPSACIRAQNYKIKRLINCENLFYRKEKLTIYTLKTVSFFVFNYETF